MKNPAYVARSLEEEIERGHKELEQALKAMESIDGEKLKVLQSKDAG